MRRPTTTWSADGGLTTTPPFGSRRRWRTARLMQGVKRGIFSAEDLQRASNKALSSAARLRQGRRHVARTLDAVMDYHQFLVRGDESDDWPHRTRRSPRLERVIERTIEDTPWKRCGCDICRAVGVEVIIFRSSNRNKRRGFHNLGVYHRHLKKPWRTQLDHLSLSRLSARGRRRTTTSSSSRRTPARRPELRADRAGRPQG